MSKVRLIDREIHTYMPMQNGAPCIAMIKGLNFVFRGETPMKARRRAEDWVRQEWEKLTPAADRNASAAAE